MGFLEMLGWGADARKARPVGTQLETGRDDDKESPTRYWLIRGGLFVALVLIALIAFPHGEVYEYTVQDGDTWRQPTLVAPFNFPVYKDPETVRVQRQQARQETPPYFRPVPNATQLMARNRDTLQQQLNTVFEAYASFRYHELRDQPDAAQADSQRFVELRRNARLKASPAQWDMLVNSYVERIPGLSTTSREIPTGPRMDERMLDAAYSIGVQLHDIGVMNRARDSILTDNVIIRNEEDNTQQKVSKNNLYGLNEAYEYAQDQLGEQFASQQAPSDLAYAFFRAIFQPSLKYMRALTLRERERAAQQIMAIQGGVEEGEIIVSQGEQVDAEIKRKLTSLERERNDRLDAPIPWKQFTGELLLSIAIYLLFFLFLYFLEQRLFANTRAILIISLLFAFAVGLFGVVVRLPEVALYIVPVAVVSVLFTIVFHSRLGLMGTLTLAMLGGSMLGFDLEYTLATFFAGMLGVFSVRDIKDRGQFFISALIVFAGFVVVLTASWLYMGAPLERYGWDVLFAGVGASFIIASQILLWIVERSFGVTTDLTLLELSDTNRPLLKELSLRAPGTFNHSLQVANLAEAAADRIGANSLLARVGALYHDIGKMLKPEYYVENQRAGVNPHDKLKPRMSALIIASHVKEGLEMAKEYNLPPRVLQFIPTHHGTTRIEYFYRRALEQTDDESNVLESEFRYPGPRPDTKETGILMLADSVEAACRSLDDPTHNRIKSLIDIIFRQHIDDGQLDNTDLTFRDLSTIRETFLSMLMGVYHVRVKYPDQDDEQDADIADRNGISDVLHVEPRATANISIVLDDNIWSGSDVGINITDLERAAESETIDQNEPPEANGRRAGERDEASVQERETARGSLDQRQE